MQKLNSRIAIIIFIGAVIILGIYRFTSPKKTEVGITPGDVKNISYTINGVSYMLSGGKTEVEVASGSAEKQTVMIFGEPVYADLNGDSVEDAAVMLTTSGEGSGTFYYAALAIASGTTFVSTNPLLLGDRIAPQAIEINDGVAVYNYAIRSIGEPFTTQPSLGKSLHIYYDKKTGEIGELVKNFEGEVDPNKMVLGFKTWEWTLTQMANGQQALPKKPGVFTLTFENDGKVLVGTDCNQGSGTFSRGQGNILTLGSIASTKMFCEGSQENDFVSAFSQVTSYYFTLKGDLVLRLANNAGEMRFK